MVNRRHNYCPSVCSTKNSNLYPTNRKDKSGSHPDRWPVVTKAFFCRSWRPTFIQVQKSLKCHGHLNPLICPLMTSCLWRHFNHIWISTMKIKHASCRKRLQKTKTCLTMMLHRQYFTIQIFLVLNLNPLNGCANSTYASNKVSYLLSSVHLS